MITLDDARTLAGGTAYGPDGDKVGTVGQIYLDNDTGQPEWATISTGLFGTKESFVPLSDAQVSDGGLRIAYDKDRVKGAPQVDADRELGPAEEDELYAYYGISSSSGTAGTSGTSGTTHGSDDDLVETGTSYTGAGSGDSTYTGAGSDAGTTTTGGIGAGTAAGVSSIGRDDGYDTSGPTTDDAMTRSEERVRAGTERVEAGRARLRKYVVTEHQEVSVPVTREEVRVEREPVTDANIGDATSGPDLSEEEHEIVLNEERPVVTTEAVPVERVRLTKDEVEDTETVGVDVREERIETDSGTDAGTTRR